MTDTLHERVTEDAAGASVATGANEPPFFRSSASLRVSIISMFVSVPCDINHCAAAGKTGVPSRSSFLRLRRRRGFLLAGEVQDLNVRRHQIRAVDGLAAAVEAARPSRPRCARPASLAASPGESHDD